MASSKPISPLIKTFIRPSRAPYICTPCLRQQQHQQQRNIQNAAARLPVPKPTPFVPDVQTFLTLIGRGLSAQASKFTSWDQLFTMSSEEMRDAGIEPARTRRYLLRWRQKFRNGQYGVGGDLQHVKDGAAELRVIEVPSLKAPEEDTYFSATHTPGKTRLVLNVPEGVTTYDKLLKPGQSPQELKKPRDYRLKEGHIIKGPYALSTVGDGTVARVKVTEGMWEDRLGQKVFGGERRRASVLHKLGVAEHRKAIGTAR